MFGSRAGGSRGQRRSARNMASAWAPAGWARSSRTTAAIGAGSSSGWGSGTPYSGGIRTAAASAAKVRSAAVKRSPQQVWPAVGEPLGDRVEDVPHLGLGPSRGGRRDRRDSGRSPASGAGTRPAARGAPRPEPRCSAYVDRQVSRAAQPVVHPAAARAVPGARRTLARAREPRPRRAGPPDRAVARRGAWRRPQATMSAESASTRSPQTSTGTVLPPPARRTASQ